MNKDQKAEMMLTAYEIEKGMKNLEEAKRAATSEMPEAQFVFMGMSAEFVYFNLVAKPHMLTLKQRTDIIQKTRFMPLSISEEPVYIGKFKMHVM